MKSGKSSPKEKSELFENFLKSFNQKVEVEERLGLAIGFMRKVLDQSVGEGFIRDFWNAKKLCIPLFKEKMHPIKRNHFWSEYIELVDEARKLKEIMDEQSAFSIKQIELAIEALEGDLEHYNALLEQIPICSFPFTSRLSVVMKKKYSPLQRELQLLKGIIARLDALRKETLSTDMRISHKNRLLKRLSKLGDCFFPKRKALISRVSDEFVLDVEAFVRKHFSSGGEGGSGSHRFILREIREWQALTKILTLNKHAFTKARVLLSECWDRVKMGERDHVQEMEENSEGREKNFQMLSDEMKAFAAACAKGAYSQRQKVVEETQAIQEKIHHLSLNRNHRVMLLERLKKSRTEAFNAIKDNAIKSREAGVKKVQKLSEELVQTIAQEQNLSLEELRRREKGLKEHFEQLSSLSHEKTLVFERYFSDLRGFILDKRGGEALSKEELELLLDDRETFVEEIKEQIEVYRREMGGGSNLDFEQAMTYRELFDSAKIHLEREVTAIQQLEEKLSMGW